MLMVRMRHKHVQFMTPRNNKNDAKEQIRLNNIFIVVDSFILMSTKYEGDPRSQRNAAILTLLNSYLVDKK